MTTQNFIDKMIFFFPNIKSEKEKHIEEYGELLATIFFEDSIMPYIIDLLKSEDSEKLKSVFEYFEDVSINADENLDNIFSITILEMIGDDRAILDVARNYMGKETIKKQKQADIDLRREIL